MKGDVGVALAVRRARMAHRCLPPSTARAGYVVHGEVGDDEGGRLAAEGALGTYVTGTGSDDPDGTDTAVPPPGL